MRLILIFIFLIPSNSFSQVSGVKVDFDESRFAGGSTKNKFEYRVDKNGKWRAYHLDPLSGKKAPVLIINPNKALYNKLYNRKKADLKFDTFPICGCKTCYLNDGFGPRKHPITGRYTPHGGRDISGPAGSAIVAIESGFIFVRREDPSLGYGRQLEIEHSKEFGSSYSHLTEIVRPAGYVEKGELIGFMGTTGDSTGNHLHIEIIKYGKNSRWVTPKNSSKAKKGKDGKINANKINGRLEKAGVIRKLNPDTYIGFKKVQPKKEDKSARFFGGDCNFSVNRISSKKRIDKSFERASSLDAGS